MSLEETLTQTFSPTRATRYAIDVPPAVRRGRTQRGPPDAGRRRSPPGWPRWPWSPVAGAAADSRGTGRPGRWPAGASSHAAAVRTRANAQSWSGREGSSGRRDEASRRRRLAIVRRVRDGAASTRGRTAGGRPPSAVAVGPGDRLVVAAVWWCCDPRASRSMFTTSRSTLVPVDPGVPRASVTTRDGRGSSAVRRPGRGVRSALRSPAAGLRSRPALAERGVTATDGGPLVPARLHAAEPAAPLAPARARDDVVGRHGGGGSRRASSLAGNDWPGPAPVVDPAPSRPPTASEVRRLGAAPDGRHPGPRHGEWGPLPEALVDPQGAARRPDGSVLRRAVVRASSVGLRRRPAAGRRSCPARDVRPRLASRGGAGDHSLAFGRRALSARLLRDALSAAPGSTHPDPPPPVTPQGHSWHFSGVQPPR